MEPLKVLLIDNSDTTKEALDRAPLARSSRELDVTLVPARNGNGHSGKSLATADVVLIGEKLSRKKVVEWTGKLRSMGYGCPILLLTRQSEARLTAAYHEAGIDDLLNIADISTPLFSWTLTSTLRAVVERRKASEYDYLRDRLNSIKRSLTTLMYELNTPLSVIRLAVYHLENSNPTRAKRDLYHGMMVENIERIETKLKDLYHIRRLLTIERKVKPPGSAR
jgi:signal transduction histidine kinase